MGAWNSSLAPGISMSSTPKVFESPLAPQLAREILDIPVEGGETVGSLVKKWGDMMREVEALVEKTNVHLQQSQVARIVAKSIAQDLKKRGEASIVVKTDGSIMLRVSYAGEPEEKPTARPRRDTPAVLTLHQSDLPYLDALREEASALGVDISHLGRQRKAIHEYLQAHRRNRVEAESTQGSR